MIDSDRLARILWRALLMSNARAQRWRDRCDDARSKLAVAEAEIERITSL